MVGIVSGLRNGALGILLGLVGALAGVGVRWVWKTVECSFHESAFDRIGCVTMWDHIIMPVGYTMVVAFVAALAGIAALQVVRCAKNARKGARETETLDPGPELAKNA